MQEKKKTIGYKRPVNRKVINRVSRLCNQYCDSSRLLSSKQRPTDTGTPDTRANPALDRHVILRARG